MVVASMLATMILTATVMEIVKLKPLNRITRRLREQKSSPMSAPVKNSFFNIVRKVDQLSDSPRITMVSVCVAIASAR